MEATFKRITKGFLVRKSHVYHGRFECVFYGKDGVEIKKWIRERFGDDDLVYTNSNIDSNVIDGCDALLTDEQLLVTTIVWK